jgi:phosphoserine phosphatase RsbU/P
VRVSLVDLATVIVGSLFVAIAAAAGAIAASARPRMNRSAAWFAAFCALYGVRLLADATLVQIATGWPPRILDYIQAFITYAILTPGTLFVDSLVGASGPARLRRAWQFFAVCAVAAMFTDAIVGRPYAAIAFNAPLVVIALAVWFWPLARLSGRAHWSREARWVVTAGAILVATVLYETIFRRGLLGTVDAEPLAMLLFIAALGWLVLTHAREQQFSYAALSRELDLARTIQQSLLPRQMPTVPGLQIAGVYQPMTAVAGDLYDVLPLAGGRVLVLVADVSGHGVPAALVASMVKVAVAAEADRYDAPGEILAGINRALTGKFERAYVTACCVIVDPSRHVVAYASAGHPPSLLRRANGTVESLDRGGVVLALMPVAAYPTTEVPFAPGDRLLLYTDGLTEAPRAGGDEFFGDNELARVLASSSASDDLLRTVVSAHRRWIGENAVASDDMSLVLIDCIEDVVTV